MLMSTPSQVNKNEGLVQARLKERGERKSVTCDCAVYNSTILQFNRY
jgi:hypothetical protein